MDAIMSRILSVPWYSYLLLIAGAVMAYGAKPFISRQSFDDEKKQKYIMNLKMTGLLLVAAGAVLSFVGTSM